MVVVLRHYHKPHGGCRARPHAIRHFDGKFVPSRTVERRDVRINGGVAVVISKPASAPIGNAKTDTKATGFFTGQLFFDLRRAAAPSTPTPNKIRPAVPGSGTI